MDNSTIWNIQLDTYKKELERYGIDTIELTEELFFHDSVLMTDFINIIDQENNEEKRWLLALVVIDNHLESFSYSLTEKLSLLKNLKESFYNEFNNSKLLRRQVSDKYRNEKNKIAAFFNEIYDETPNQILREILLRKKNKISCLVTEITKRQNNLLVDYNKLNSHYIHMSMNRLFKSNNRKHELICYDFLYNYYNTRLILNLHLEKTKILNLENKT